MSSELESKENGREKASLPIGFMDSGLGGLSVLREAVRIMPEEDFIRDFDINLFGVNNFSW